MKQGALRRLVVNQGESLDAAVAALMATAPEGVTAHGALITLKLNGPMFPEIEDSEQYPYVTCGGDDEQDSWDFLTGP